MSYTTNLSDDDPRQRLFSIQQRVLNDEDVSDAELQEALSILRKQRGKSVEKAESEGRTAGRGKAKKPEADLDDILSGNL